jgi:2-hydroxy-3-keto-5-methylthiopentenyl-1-phosphate phosphatase
MQETEVFCDFDGTITRIDLTDAVLEAFALPAFKKWEQLWRLGKISSQECLSRQAELIQADEADLIRFAATVPIDEGIFTLERHCAESRIPLTIVSDGIDVLIGAVLHAHGLSHLPVFSNRLKWENDGLPFLRFPYARPDCHIGAGTCKCALALTPRATPKHTVYIGDSQSDQCVAAKAHRVFAKGTLREWCEHQGITCEAFETLTQVAERLYRERAL